MQLFDDTANYYSKFRIPYPPELFTFLLKLADPDPEKDIMLDLGCGTGELSIPLSHNFAKVFGIDPAADMLAEAEKKSQNLKNIEWVAVRAEDFCFDSRVKLITLGKSLHWMDMEKVMMKTRQALVDQGVIAIIGGQSSWTGSHGWELESKKVIKQFLGSERHAGSTDNLYHEPDKDFKQLLKENFGNVDSHQFEYTVFRSINQITGYLYSTSYSAKKLYGDRAAEFEETLRKNLLDLNPDGLFETDVRIELIWSVNRE